MPRVKWTLGFLAEEQKSHVWLSNQSKRLRWAKELRNWMEEDCKKVFGQRNLKVWDVWISKSICKVQNKRRDAGGNVMVWGCIRAGEREISTGIKEQWTKNAFAPVCYSMLHPGTRMEPISSYQRTMLWELLDPVAGNKWSSSQSNYCEALQEIWRNKFPDNFNKELKYQWSARLYLLQIENYFTIAKCLKDNILSSENHYFQPGQCLDLIVDSFCSSFDE